MKLKTSLFLFLAIFASITNNQAANIPINYLPFTINSPGNYVLNKDLTAPYSKTPAITVGSPVGNIVLDLQGHTIHAAPVPFKELNTVSQGILVWCNGGAYGETIIQNGTLEGFAVGLVTATASPDEGADVLFTNLTVKNDPTSPVNSIAIHLNGSSGTRIVGCRFVGAGQMGIFDDQSEVGNSYSNLHFDGTLTTNIQVNNHPAKPFPFAQIVNFSSTWNEFPTAN
jgi:hypothetical protein